MNVPTVIPRMSVPAVRRPQVPAVASSLTKHLVLIVAGGLVAYPFYFMVSSSLKPFFEATLVPPTLWPHEVRLENYQEVWNKAPWARYFANTLLVAGSNTLGELVTSVLAAYAFAWMNFKGRAALFALLLATYMMPGEATLIPNFVIVSKRYLNLYDTYWVQILPFLATAFSIFLLRQQFLSVPRELYDAAIIDGAGHLRFLWSVVLPVSVPALVTVSIIAFYGSWNAFQWPLIVTSTPDIRPIQVGLNAFRAEAGSSYHLLMAAASFVVAPIVLLYLVGQRYLVQGVARTGIRG
ncbi:MAG TPA: carbohydrate ABC transporter permease [Candidatus Limnocylindria bacterium]|nr:carbohydrate ABC transporter permease [Candidatus Limnocylindria bacterium]